jgi:hypothetical protein
VCWRDLDHTETQPLPGARSLVTRESHLSSDTRAVVPNLHPVQGTIITQDPWEVFFTAWERSVARDLYSPRPKDSQHLERHADAIRDAARETTDYLRDTLEWSWINSRVLAGKFVEAADDWLLRGAVHPRLLRSRLREVWSAEQSLCRVEEERRRTTEAILAGVTGDAWGGERSPAEHDHVFELHIG